MSEYGEKLRHKLFLLRKDGKDLALEVGIAPNTIYNATSGRHDLQESNKLKINAVLDRWEKEKEEGK